MKLIRWILGRIILLIEWVAKPRDINRSAEEQRVLDNATKHISLYQLQACPFCVLVRHTMKKHGLNLHIRDVKRDPSAMAELIGWGGKFQVPCLRIEHGPGKVEWLYEWRDIKQYMTDNFAMTPIVERSSAN